MEEVKEKAEEVVEEVKTHVKQKLEKAPCESAALEAGGEKAAADEPGK